MDVICFLCVTLGSSTVQLHESLGIRRVRACSEARFNSENGDSVWRVQYRRAAFCCDLSWAKELDAKKFVKDMFPVHDGKYLSSKAVHNWVKKFSQRRSKAADDTEMAETTVKRLLSWGFPRTRKAMGLLRISMLVENMSRKISPAPFRISHVLCFISICVLFADYPSSVPPPQALSKVQHFSSKWFNRWWSLPTVNLFVSTITTKRRSP
jgi:hypothetical protein